MGGVREKPIPTLPLPLKRRELLSAAYPALPLKGREGKAALLEFLPLQGGGWEGDGLRGMEEKTIPTLPSP